ncbi:hypothetical protein C8Q80DRAFT_1276098 [Daedaleopsis nitida]|nr:hypothetical protein C8Q80DRAFT_1276098 [Daedaleopsis nitida]
MDSQATLVDPTELPDRYAHTELLFSRDSLTNADLVVRGRTTVVYTIRTPGKSLSRTELCHIEGAEERPVVVACIERNEILPDTIRYRDWPRMKYEELAETQELCDLFPWYGREEIHLEANKS